MTVEKMNVSHWVFNAIGMLLWLAGIIWGRM